ncbi:MAG: PAS domain-containing sensor histidine kinase [Sporichthyaceae bacterium]|nr:PAS domain-containing sensor histidine kinase [Sporichthyaceae bacterium]
MPVGLPLELDEVPDGVIVADETGQVVAVNAAAERLTGIVADEAVGKHIEEALPLYDAIGRPWWTCTDPYGGLATRSRQPERALSLPDGRTVLVTARYVRDRPLGQVVKLVVGLRSTVARDRQDRESSELIATVAHELRSPLTSVKGFTATLLAKWGRFSDDQKRLMLETVEADADRITRLITELLDIARIDTGRLQLHRQVVDLPAVARRQVAALAATGVPASRLRMQVAVDLPELWLDPDKIDQVLGNLLENAVRHGAGTVTIAVQAIPGGAAVTVSDQGPGIPPELAARVFTKFWRGNRRPGGTGLGLYIAKGLVEAHGGSIEVERSTTGGASFRFTVPAGAPDFAR